MAYPIYRTLDISITLWFSLPICSNWPTADEEITCTKRDVSFYTGKMALSKRLSTCTTGVPENAILAVT